ncbi:hypothetical protein LEP1GSC068_0372 [Leptospira sp. Fiocruz LV3954]|nr:hypothetical protein LEP1GSC068_0372 [Leptospira sp. Fiocruz LV3954]EMI63999.1 hypothetical protein LEP1GSC076_2479 [Leptospira sp. Fiocruz LV4135]
MTIGSVKIIVDCITKKFYVPRKNDPLFFVDPSIVSFQKIKLELQ